MLTKDSYSQDEVLRRQARTAVSFLKDWPLPPGAEHDLPSTPLGFRNDDDDRPASFEWTPDSLPDLIDPADVDERERAVAGWERVLHAHPGSRVAYDAVETERRRRRREAMVLHEGSGRIEEGDIIRPR